MVRQPRSRQVRAQLWHVLWLAAAVLIPAAPAQAQVTAVVDVIDGHGRAMVRNTSTQSVSVTVALWESDESTGHVQLVRRVRANVWPIEFDLPPGETQVIRISLSDGAYPPETLLRLETRLLPTTSTGADGPPGGGARTQVILATRFLSKVLVH